MQPRQSDICHQSVYELVHSEDREELMQQLKWSSLIPQQQQQGASLTNGTEPQVGAVAGNGEQAAAKQAAQMSIQEILSSREYPPKLISDRFLIPTTKLTN